MPVAYAVDAHDRIPLHLQLFATAKQEEKEGRCFDSGSFRIASKSCQRRKTGTALKGPYFLGPNHADNTDNNGMPKG
ncbi:MAG: hypothetical protein DDT20_01159 [Firmicutes bacterium]|nr:hypothetical protein [Bacillota bacterium]